MGLYKMLWVVGTSALVGVQASDASIPEHFDTRQKWYGCGMQTLNQGQCGSCWAVSAAGVFSDRACIWLDENGQPINNEVNESYLGNRLLQRAGTCTGEGTTHEAHNHGCKRTAQVLSPQPLVSCGNEEQDKKLYPDSAGCNGGEALDAWRYFFLHGTTTMNSDGISGCIPYTSGRCAKPGELNFDGCRKCVGLTDECEDTGKAPTMYKVGSYGWIMEEGLEKRAFTGKPRPASDKKLMDVQVEKMQRELMTNGPLHVCIDYFDNFGGFFNNSPLGIYNSTENLPKTGGHCLSIIGWGTDKASGLDYWMIRNSWGADWGTDGLFRFRRGVDLCGVESDVWAACPEGSKCQLTDGVYRMEHTDSKEHAVVEKRIEELMLTYTDNVFYTARSLRQRETRQPSKNWRGGYWHEMPREDFSSRPFALRIAHAYEAAFGEPTDVESAVRVAHKVWTKPVGHGINVRVQFRVPEKDSHVETNHLHYHDGRVAKL